MNLPISDLPRLIDANQTALADAWMARLKSVGGNARLKDAELRTQTRSVLGALRAGLAAGEADIQGAAYEPLRELLAEVSRSRADLGFAPSETASFVFSLKQPLFEIIQKAYAGDAPTALRETWGVSVVLDQLGLYTGEVYQKSREEVIVRQQREIAELSTPVVTLWKGILALPLIGTLDSSRTQVVMSNLLQAIVDEEAEIAIIDITGVPMVDTLVAQHLLKTIAAARLMGADCLISGIRPQIAQTMVHLGVELDVVSKASLADAFALALRRLGKTVVTKSDRKA